MRSDVPNAVARKNHTTEEHRGPERKKDNKKGRSDKEESKDEKKPHGGRCHCCGESGHFMKECPERKEFTDLHHGQGRVLALAAKRHAAM